MEIELGLCKGRHEIAEISDYIFSEEDTNMEVMPFSDMIKMLEVKADVRVAQMVENGYDHLNLYVTGMTPGIFRTQTHALMAVVNACWANKLKLTLYHYDKSNDIYVPQEIFQSANVNFKGGL